jgi:SNF2 family DNA or RNA helicase
LPRIFDNIDKTLLPVLRETLTVSCRADFCVGYFNLRGWRQIDDLIEGWQGTDTSRCRLLVGMSSRPEDELRQLLRNNPEGVELDQQTAVRLKRQMAEHFRNQLMQGTPTNADEAGLRRLSTQLKSGKLVVKLYLRHSLHAKLYLLHRQDIASPIIGFLGSSNLTFSGLSYQGELNVDVLEQDAAQKLSNWFEDRWGDRWCLDISSELAQIIDESWAREQLPTPYEVYLKMAYHLSQEARLGLAEFNVPRDLTKELLEFQAAAVRIAAHHLNKRGGVVIGDVVGLGKTLMATALARVFQEDYITDTLIICPVNLVKMWQDYVERYRLIAKVLPISQVTSQLQDLRRYRVVLIDESHNLRNREGKRYRAIKEYIAINESKCILLSATPYNKSYLDISSQLRLFVPEDKDLGIRPENLLRDIGETEFIRRHQAAPRTLAAFEKSEHPDDWRELLRLYMVRRTRTFIQQNYAKTDEEERRYLLFQNGTRSYFPKRVPKALRFDISEADNNDPYARLYSEPVVKTISRLALPRYGLGNYVLSKFKETPTASEQELLANLSRAGKRLMGFSRTNLFKRLESGGPAFLQSLERHVLRNYVFLHAIENNLPLPLGTQDVAMLETAPAESDIDADALLPLDDEEAGLEELSVTPDDTYRQQAADIYGSYATRFQRRFKWLRPVLFEETLKEHLEKDAKALLKLLTDFGEWQSQRDTKLQTLVKVLTEQHPNEKVLIFTQFADTVDYLTTELKTRGLTHLAGVTGGSLDPTSLAWQFSPKSNRKNINPKDELRVLIATDVLSEGQNLQDAHVIINFDLPWAIIRLIQRAGRVDRIGQQAQEILCYSFLPAEGVERIINLRGRVRERLRENAEVVGTDEIFFEDDQNDMPLFDLYNEKSGILDGDAEGEVDLASYAYQIWQNAFKRDPTITHRVEAMPNVVYSSKAHQPDMTNPEGVLVYVKTASDNDALAWLDKEGTPITMSQLRILQAAECTPDTPTMPRLEQHHTLVSKGLEHLAKEEQASGGQLGRPSGARFRSYERLKRYADKIKGSLFESPELLKAIDEIYRYPLLESARDTLNRQLKSGIGDEKLAELVLALRTDDRLCHIGNDETSREPQIICSLGLVTR